jgi:hypothetical protein
MCIPTEITVSEVKGRVYYEYEGKRIILDDAVVQVVSKRDNRVLAEMTTDSGGRYSIRGIKPGRYWLRAKHPQVIGFSAALVRTSKPPNSSATATQIVFVLGADPSKPCGGSYVELVRN